MEQKRKKLGEVLIENGFVDEFQLKSALAQQEKWGKRLGETLIDLGFISENSLMKALSKFFHVPSINIGTLEVPPQVVALVPVALAEKYVAMPLAIKNIEQKKRLVVAMVDPTDLAAVDELQFKSGMKILPMVSTISGIQKAIRRYYHKDRSLPVHIGDDRSGISMIADEDEISRMELIRGGNEDSVRTSGESVGNKTGEASAKAEAVALDRLGGVLKEKRLMNTGEFKQILGHKEPIAVLARLLFDKKIISRDELLLILDALQSPSKG